MKQHYLFTCAASLFCALAANAQEAVIDSLVEYNGNDERISLSLFRYNDQLLVEEQSTYSWDATTGKWGTEMSGQRTYAYDEQGRVIRSEYQTIGYQESYVYTYEGQGRTFEFQYTQTLNGEEYSMQQYGEQELDENGNVVKQNLYFYAGTDDEYLASVTESTYDDQNRQLTSKSTGYDREGNVITGGNSENVYYDGESFINTYSGFDNIAGTETNYQIKREISEGNPKIAVQYMKYEGETEWTKTWSGYYYYPDGGSTTANEAIQAEPNMRLYTADGTIHLQLTEPQWVEVYTISGQCRYRKVVSGSTSIPVTKGIYIIRAGKETVKVQVR